MSKILRFPDTRAVFTRDERLLQLIRLRGDLMAGLLATLTGLMVSGDLSLVLVVVKDPKFAAAAIRAREPRFLTLELEDTRPEWRASHYLYPIANILVFDAATFVADRTSLLALSRQLKTIVVSSDPKHRLPDVAFLEARV